ncbi:MAG: EAL domain-containing protein [Bacillota bacterium]
MPFLTKDWPTVIENRQNRVEAACADMHGGPTNAQSHGTRLLLYGWLLAIGWTLAVAGLLTWNIIQIRHGDIEEAKARIDMARMKDVSYRRWVQKNGGVYVPVSKSSPPNEYLQVPERDITTPSGVKLTLVNSSYMMRQVVELSGDTMAVRTHVTSLKPLRPTNTPDPGEAKALHEFERGAKQVLWREWQNGTEYLRFMRPYFVEQTCMKCHAQQGYKVGDIRGGIATSVALPTIACSMASMWPTFVGFGLLWLAGLSGIGVAWRSLTRHERGRQQIENQLRHAALHDALTHLPNRASFMNHLSGAIDRERREGRGFGMLYLDLDRFKVVNDGMGHGTGDELLIATAARLQQCLEDMRALCGWSLIARLGGDEFVVLLRDLKAEEDAQRIAEKIQQCMAEPFVVSGQEIYSSVSIGLVMSGKRYTQPEEVLRDADTALYSAKRAGRARHVVFTREMHDLAKRWLQMDNDLRKAIERHEFVTHYQPITSLESGRVLGFEALVRWQHPERGMVSPLEFIPVAEETGLILSIGWKVLETACRQLRQLEQEYPDRPLWVSVNLSKRQLMERDLVDQVAKLIKRTQITPRQLKLEVTESMVMEHAESVTPVLEELRQLGVKLAMDDFGTGHSSLSCLHQFPVHCLKIDRAFVCNMGLNRQYAAIVHAVVTLAHNLGMEVIAEGVETLDQVALLQAMDCDSAQGYLFSKPVPVSNMAGLIATESWLRKAA